MEDIKIQYLKQIKKHIEEAELVVIGLGEEWNISPEAQFGELYQRIVADLKGNPEYQWILPFVYYQLTDESLIKAYKALFAMLEGKNYYVVATTVNRRFVPFAKEGRVVMPCGSDAYMRDETLTEYDDTESGNAAVYREFLESMKAYIRGDISLEKVSVVRDSTGEIIPFNSVYAVGYKEERYLPDWNKYMSWLQGTMNRKTCLLELGAGLQFPSVFRFPFEKMAYFNQKAFCFRVHKSLYQLTEEMAERSESVPMHAVELFGEAE